VLFHIVSAPHVEHLTAALPAVKRVLLNGDVAVAVFFALSGFVIAHALGDRHVDGRYASFFMARRMVRIGPPYWASLVLVLATVSYFPRLHPTPTQVAVHVLHLQDILGFPPLSPVYWTLCLEVQFYVLACAILLFADRLGSRRTVIGVVAALNAATVAGWLRVPSAPGWFVGLFYTFLAGALAWWALDGTIGRSEFYAYALLIAVTGAATGKRFAPVAAATAVALLELGRRGELGRRLRWAPVQALAAVSYSLYLTHNPAMAVTSGVLYRYVPRTAAWETLWVATLLAGAFAVAALFYVLVERPALRFSRRVR
jgi:peptidoglycan/LPS O-acetylase OafA/YrhL